VTTARSLLRDFAYRHVGGSVVVLVYHRVAALEHDPQLLSVTPERFEAQLRMLAEHFQVLSLNDVASGLARRRLPRRGVAITFDDGYADNLHAALPVLESVGIPATVFVSSGYADAPREYWWDEIERLTLLPETLPPLIELQAGDTSFRAELGEAARVVAHGADAPPGWDVTVPPSNDRQRLYLGVAAFLRKLDAPSREQALSQLRARVPDAPPERPAYLPMTAAEVAELDSRPMIDVGGHTVNHVLLSALPPHRQEEEIRRDRERLTEICGHAPRHFAYPYGAFGDFTDESASAAMAAGYDLACANYPRPVKSWTAPDRIPRHLVRDWDALELAERMERWFEGPGANETGVSR